MGHTSTLSLHVWPWSSNAPTISRAVRLVRLIGEHCKPAESFKTLLVWSLLPGQAKPDSRYLYCMRTLYSLSTLFWNSFDVMPYQVSNTSKTWVCACLSFTDSLLCFDVVYTVSNLFKLVNTFFVGSFCLIRWTHWNMMRCTMYILH